MRDSLGKIAQRYLAAVAAAPFELNGVSYTPPERLVITTRAWQDYTCPSGCGGCCPKFDLVYLPDEYARFEGKYPARARMCEQVIVHSGKTNRTIFVDRQDGNPSFKCKHLNWENGRCGIHRENPFHCAIEILRFLRRSQPVETVFIGTQLFSRGWAMRRTDGGVGAKCEVVEPNARRIKEVESHLQHLVKWADYFDIPVLPEFRIFRYRPWMLTSNVMMSHRHRSLRTLVDTDESKLVQLRRRIVRVEEER